MENCELAPEIQDMSASEVPSESSEAQVSVESSSNENRLSHYKSRKAKKRARRRTKKSVLKEEYIDIIKDAFWDARPWILA